MSTHPYGTWPSPFTASSIASQTIGLTAVTVDGMDVYWLEARPQEGGRMVLVRRSSDGVIVDVNPPATNVRTRVHEYGGGAYCVHARVAYYVDFADQRVYRQRGSPVPAPITPEGGLRYGDFAVDEPRRRLICVREDHREKGEPTNALVSLPMDAGDPSEGVVIAQGYDFYSTPKVSPDGRTLAWLAWRHPNMPWDGTELWRATLRPDGQLENAVIVAGGPAESIFQPGWSPAGELYFVSDRDGWWRFYRGASEAVPVLAAPPARTEFGRAQWVLGMHTWAFVDSAMLVTTFVRDGHAGLGLIEVDSGDYREISSPVEPIDDIAVISGDVVFVGASSTQMPAVVRMGLRNETNETLRVAAAQHIDTAYVSRPEAIEFPTDSGETAHAFYYAPTNPSSRAPADERPPLIVIIHGGPTDAARPTLRLGTQDWTSRGFAVVDVNYGGSTGFGRSYRDRLKGQWGVVDVADCVSAVRFLVAAGRADPKRLIIRGGSAGGYTTLRALTSHPAVFNAAASHYGICDLEVLAGDTHKFESRYGDTLIGPYPEAREIYRERSPIHHVDTLSCPLIVFHGAEDKVVPPNQAQLLVDAVRAKGLPVALIVFEGEQHGFRQASSVIRALEAELWFYGAVFGFAPADTIDPVEVANL